MVERSYEVVGENRRSTWRKKISSSSLVYMSNAMQNLYERLFPLIHFYHPFIPPSINLFDLSAYSFRYSYSLSHASIPFFRLLTACPTILDYLDLPLQAPSTLNEHKVACNNAQTCLLTTALDHTVHLRVYFQFWVSTPPRCGPLWVAISR